LKASEEGTITFNCDFLGLKLDELDFL